MVSKQGGRMTANSKPNLKQSTNKRQKKEAIEAQNLDLIEPTGGDVSPKKKRRQSYVSQDTGPVGIRVGRVKTDMRKRMRAEMMEQGIEGSPVDEADLDARVNEVFKKAPLPEHPGDPVFAPYTGPRGAEVALLESAPPPVAAPVVNMNRIHVHFPKKPARSSVPGSTRAHKVDSLKSSTKQLTGLSPKQQNDIAPERGITQLAKSSTSGRDMARDTASVRPYPAPHMRVAPSLSFPDHPALVGPSAISASSFSVDNEVHETLGLVRLIDPVAMADDTSRLGFPASVPYTREHDGLIPRESATEHIARIRSTQERIERRDATAPYAFPKRQELRQHTQDCTDALAQRQRHQAACVGISVLPSINTASREYPERAMVSGVNDNSLDNVAFGAPAVAAVGLRTDRTTCGVSCAYTGQPAQQTTIDRTEIHHEHQVLTLDKSRQETSAQTTTFPFGGSFHLSSRSFDSPYAGPRVSSDPWMTLLDPWLDGNYELDGRYPNDTFYRHLQQQLAPCFGSQYPQVPYAQPSPHLASPNWSDVARLGGYQERESVQMDHQDHRVFPAVNDLLSSSDRQEVQSSYYPSALTGRSNHH